MEEQKKSLVETLNNISKNLDALVAEKKVKKWSLPWRARFLGKKKKRKGYAVFMHLGNNKAVTFVKAQVEEGVAMVNGIPHVVSPEDIYIWKNKIPIVIQPEYSEHPLRASDHYEAVESKKEGSRGWLFFVNYMMKNQIKEKKQLKGGAIIVGVLLIAGIGYYLFKSGAFT